MKQSERIALIDMDGSVADFDSAMQRDLESLRAPGEEPYVAGPGQENTPPHIKRRKSLIKQQPGWWRGLARHEPGFLLVKLLRDLEFQLHVLTKGPWNTTSAWTEKVEWCREHLPDAQVTITEDKGLVYGKVLVDDYPPYVEAWLAHRPRGLVLMPAWPWNVGAFVDHPNVIRFDGSNLAAVAARLHNLVR